MEKKTPLYDIHVASKGKMVPFAGYLLPVQYEPGVKAEHLAVRERCGLFDVSHMGEITCKGRDALANINYLMTNDFTGMYDGQARYSPMCREDGGILDDLIVYRMGDNDYLIVVNASNKEHDFQWMTDHQFGEVEFRNISDQIAQIALQGPMAYQIISKVAEAAYIPVKYYSCIPGGKLGGIDCIISKTGYTGEDGYEIYTSAEKAAAVWNLLMAAGEEFGLIPCGLGARDTLRLEAAMPLYGHEMNENTTPLEAGLSFAVKMGKTDFIGKSGILVKGEVRRKRVGLKVTGRGIIREHEKLYMNGHEVGETTSGTHCPYLGYPVAMAMVDGEFAGIGQPLEAEVRGRRITAEIVPLPFYKRNR